MAEDKYPFYTVWEDATRPGSWLVRVTFGPAKSIRRRATSAKRAEAKAKELIKRHENSMNVAGGDMTLNAFIVYYWQQVIAKRDLAPKTIEDYRDTLGGYVQPKIGNLKVKHIDAPVVIGLYHTLCEERSEALANRALTKLHMVLDAARRWRYVSYNAVADARKDLNAYEVAEKVPLTLEETQRLLETAEGLRVANLYHVALTLGLRPGELLGLQWGDIDWAARTITIRRQSQDVDGKKQVRDETKTTAGQRTLPLPPRLLERLQQQRAEKIASIFLFPNDEGGMWSPSNFTRHFRGGISTKKKNGDKKYIKGVRQKANLPDHVTPHTFRHTVATRLLEQGVPEELRAKLLGHGKKTITQRYSHATMDALRRAVEQLEQNMYGVMHGVKVGTKKEEF